jgi:hypothetical protein
MFCISCLDCHVCQISSVSLVCLYCESCLSSLFVLFLSYLSCLQCCVCQVLSVMSCLKGFVCHVFPRSCCIKSCQSCHLDCHVCLSSVNVSSVKIHMSSLVFLSGCLAWGKTLRNRVDGIWLCDELSRHVLEGEFKKENFGFGSRGNGRGIRLNKRWK